MFIGSTMSADREVSVASHTSRAGTSGLCDTAPTVHTRPGPSSSQPGHTC
uniref:Uncharacterized protein n=1 Tax=Anguilla anguilla TaxID=7936 RepID=A0A0E9WXP0_ANGAN